MSKVNENLVIFSRHVHFNFFISAALKGHLARIKKIEHSADHKRLMGPKSKMANRIPMTLEELNWALSNPLPPAPTSRKPSLFRKENPIIVLDKGKVTQLANLIRETKDDEESPYRRFRIQPVSPRKPKDRQQGGKRKKLPNSNPRPQTRFPQRIPNKLMRQHIDRSLLKIKCRPNPGDVMQYRLVKAGGDLKLVPKSQYSETDSAMSPTRNDMFNADIKSDPCTSTAPVTIAENFAKAVEKTAQLAAEKKGKIPPQLNVRPLAYGSSSALWSLAKSASIASKHSKAPSILRC